jgi:hypothetical protein
MVFYELAESVSKISRNRPHVFFGAVALIQVPQAAFCFPVSFFSVSTMYLSRVTPLWIAANATRGYKPDPTRILQQGRIAAFLRILPQPDAYIHSIHSKCRRMVFFTH